MAGRVMDWITTSTLLEGLRGFDDAAWDHFSRRFRRPLAAFVRRSGVRPADVDDVVQETLVAFAETQRNGAYQRERGRLNRWLFGIAYRQSLRQLRRYGRTEVQMETQTGRTPPIERVPDEASATDLWNRIWEKHMTLECIERIREELPSRSFRVFQLAVLEDKSAADVARSTGLDVRAVYNLKHRTLKRIREVRVELEGEE